METLIPNAVTTFGIATLPGYDAAIPSLLPELWLKGQKVGQGVLRLLGVRYAILPIEQPADPVEHRTGLRPLLDPVEGARLYRVPEPLPRVYLAGRAEMVSDADAPGRLFDPEIIAGAAVLIAPGASGPLPVEAGRAGDCALVAFSNTRVQARCRAQRPALAVFLEQHDAGWTATVDGAATPLLRANLLVRAVPVGAGEHVVALDYRPPGLRAGAVISSLSLVICTVMALTVRRRARRVR
jgi:hypothetical protein